VMSLLGASGATAEHVVNMRVTLRNTADYPGFNEAFRDYFGGDKITRTCFGGTPNRAGVNVQIDCTAMFD
jgi:2-iminobutanoate/2-iminopropanoate deaminase